MKKYSLKTYLLREGVYGDYPEDRLIPANVISTDHPPECICDDPKYCSCGCAPMLLDDQLMERVLEEEDEELLVDLEESSGAGAAAGAMGPLGGEETIEEG